MVTAFPGGLQVRGAKNTMLVTMKHAKEFHETGVGQPTAACQLMVCPSRSTLVTKGTAPTREVWSKRHRRACPRHGDTDDDLPRQVVESNALFFSLGQPVAGFLVKFRRLLPTNMVGQTCERVGDCGGSPREACYDQAEKDGDTQ